MMVGGQSLRPISASRPWTFYVLGGLFAAYLLFLYGPMCVIYLLSFQGENGGVTFPMVGHSIVWFQEIVKPGQMANIPVSFGRSVSLAAVVSCITVVFAVAAGLGFRRRFPGSGVVFYIAVASLVMPGLLVGFGIGLTCRFLGINTSLFSSALGAQLTWTLPFGMFAMFAVVNRFNRAWEEAAADLGDKLTDKQSVNAIHEASARTDFGLDAAAAALHGHATNINNFMGQVNRLANAMSHMSPAQVMELERRVAAIESAGQATQEIHR